MDVEIEKNNILLIKYLFIYLARFIRVFLDSAHVLNQASLYRIAGSSIKKSTSRLELEGL